MGKKHISARAVGRLISMFTEAELPWAVTACRLKGSDRRESLPIQTDGLDWNSDRLRAVTCQDCKVVWDAALEGRNMIGYFANAADK